MTAHDVVGAADGVTGVGGISDERAVWIALSALLLVAVAWLRARARRAARRRAIAARREGAPSAAPRERRGRSRFLLPALLFVLFNAITVVFFAWGPVFRTLGWSGIGTVVIFATPILVGLGYQWRMRALEW